MSATRVLPGISIDVAPAPPADVMPRMDVAVFVGFASTGPLHRPVAIESVAHWTNVFGPDAPLAWDAQRCERIFANLGPSVRAFFANGGRRCWVIRVARTPALEALWRGKPPDKVGPNDIATANRFALPGVLVWSGADSAAPAIAAAASQARSLGSWSDTLRVATAVSATAFVVDRFEALASSGPWPAVRFGTRAPLRSGDLVQFGDGAGQDPVSIYARIDKVAISQIPGALPKVVEATLCAAFTRLGPDASAADVEEMGTVQFVGTSGDDVNATLQIHPAAAQPVRLHFDGPLNARLADGAWARWRRVDGQRVVWLRMDRISQPMQPALAGAPDAGADGPCWQEMSPSTAALLGVGVTSGSLLTLDVQVVDAIDARWHLSGLGLTPAHPAAWWQQVSDDARDSAAIFGGAEDRFPIVALDPPAAANAPLALLPLGVDALFSTPAAAFAQAASALERDGLSRFDSELFLDPDIAPLRTSSLLEEADRIRYLRDDPRSLFGAHAALSVGSQGMFSEASLIALPDAVHLGWVRRAGAVVPPAQPKATPVPNQWVTHRGPCEPVQRPAALDSPDFSGFLDCGTRELPEPSLSARPSPMAHGACRFEWTSSAADAVYVLREATRIDLSDAREIYRGRATRFDVGLTRIGAFYYTVSALLGDEISKDSNAVAVVVRADAWDLATPDDYAIRGETELLAVHRGVLRLCAASGELFAVLGMPRHYQAPQARNYAMRLRTEQAPGGDDPTALRFDEAQALSFGSLYHPWVEVSLGSSAAAATESALAAVPRRVCAPDGFAIGVLAARALSRGAWIAPANEPLKGAVALTPNIDFEDRLSLQEAQVNLLRADARGFLVLSADTLSNALECRPINVRRLLILLRRLALRRGASYVFEPNGEALRRAVQRGFDILLGDLFRRGAFAGATASQSYKVVTDNALDTPASQETARLLVELRVAPAMPLQFLSVRLAQSGERLSVAEAL